MEYYILVNKTSLKQDIFFVHMPLKMNVYLFNKIENKSIVPAMTIMLIFHTCGIILARK